MAKLLCPHCGAPTEDFAGIDLRAFTPLQERTLTVLVEGRNRFVSASHIADRVYADDPRGGPEDAVGCVKAAIFRLRHKLPESGWEIETRWGSGYRLSRIGRAGDA